MASLFRRALRRARRRITAAKRDKTAPIYLIAAAGQPNFGDEFITRAWLDWLAAHHPKREVWLDCMEPGRAAHLFRDTHPKLRTTNTLWQTAHAGTSDDLVDATERMERLISGLGSPKTDFGLRDLRTMRSLHLLGGGYMNSIWAKNLGIIAAMTAVHRQFGVPIYATGQGLLPHDQESQRWITDQLGQFDYVEARDRPSAKAFGVHPGTDDAFLAFANKRRIYAPPGASPKKMVLVQGDMVDEDHSAPVTHLVNAFVSSARSRKDVAFAEGIPPEDARFASAHVDAGSQYFPFMRIWEEGFPAHADQEWLTSRFHFHLLAAAAGARGTIINARVGYYDIKHELLQELGTGWSTQTDITADAVTPTVSGDFPARARRLGQDKARLARRLYSAKR